MFFCFYSIISMTIRNVFFCFLFFFRGCVSQFTNLFIALTIFDGLQLLFDSIVNSYNCGQQNYTFVFIQILLFSQTYPFLFPFFFSSVTFVCHSVFIFFKVFINLFSGMIFDFGKKKPQKREKKRRYDYDFEHSFYIRINSAEIANTTDDEVTSWIKPHFKCLCTHHLK